MPLSSRLLVGGRVLIWSFIYPGLPDGMAFVYRHVALWYYIVLCRVYTTVKFRRNIEYRKLHRY